MRKCEEFEELASALIDGVLGEADRAVLMEHMAECPRCRAYFEDQTAIRRAMDRRLEEAPEGFLEGVMELVRQTPQEKPERKVIRLRSWKRWAALAACCAVAVLGVWRMDHAAEQAADTAAFQKSESAAPRCALEAGVAEDACDSGVMPEAALADAESEETDQGPLSAMPAGGIEAGKEKTQSDLFSVLPERFKSPGQDMELRLQADGSFSVTSQEEGIRFSGMFAAPAPIDEFVYSLKVEAAAMEESAGDAVLPWEEETEFLVYLPGAGPDRLPEAFLSLSSEGGLSCYGMYCAEKELIFTAEEN